MRHRFLARLSLGRVTHAYRRLLGEVENVRAAQQLAPLVTQYLPASDKTLNAFHLQYVCHELATSVAPRGATVVELGAGASTPVLATVAERAGLEFVSIEHDPRWHRLVSGWMGDEGLDPSSIHRVEIDEARRWYDHDGLDDVLDGKDVRVLLVDGPPGSGASARLPARDYLSTRDLPLTDVFIDDCHRADERELAGSLAAASDATVDFVGARRELAHVRLRRPARSSAIG